MCRRRVLRGEVVEDWELRSGRCEWIGDLER